MSLFNLHLVALSDAQHAIVKAALADAGHELETYAGSETAKLWAEIKTKFPDVVSGVEKGIADLKDSSLSGGDKAVKVATDVLALAPAVLAAIPGIKDVFVHGVTEAFSDTESEFATVGAEALAKIVAAF